MNSLSFAQRVLIWSLLFALASSAVACGTKTRVASQWLSPDYKGGPMLDRQPVDFGIADNDVPEGYLRQLLHPFRSRSRF